LGWEDEADAAKVVFHVNRHLDITELEGCVDFACHFELGTDIEDSIKICLVSANAKPMRARHLRVSTYPGKERPGTPTSKSGMLPELTCPVTLAVTLKFASMVPSNPTLR
jgi:hypothetical protein